MSEAITYQPIGWVESPFTDIEGMPIQPAGAAGIRGTIRLAPLRRGLDGDLQRSAVNADDPVARRSRLDPQSNARAALDRRQLEPLQHPLVHQKLRVGESRPPRVRPSHST